jgi:hypothetical protein
MALVQARNSSDHCTSSWPFDFQLFHFSHLAFLKNLSEPQKTHPAGDLLCGHSAFAVHDCQLAVAVQPMLLFHCP